MSKSLTKSFPKIAVGPARHATSHDENSHGPHEHVNENEGSTRSTFQLLQQGSGQRSSQLNSSALFALPRLNLQFVRRLHWSRPKSTFSVAKDESTLPMPPEVPAAALRDPNASLEDNQTFTYLMVGGAGVTGAMAAKSTVMNFLSTLSASGDVLAMAQVEMDLSSIPEGKSVVIKWRGKPIFIRHRTPAEIEAARNVDISHLRDPQADADRVQRPEWLVMLGICTHLGCVPTSDAGDYGGWYCPCQ